MDKALAALAAAAPAPASPPPSAKLEPPTPGTDYGDDEFENSAATPKYEYPSRPTRRRRPLLMQFRRIGGGAGAFIGADARAQAAATIGRWSIFRSRFYRRLWGGRRL